MRPPRSLRTAFSQVSASSGMLSGSGCRRRRHPPSPGCCGTCCSTCRASPTFSSAPAGADEAFAEVGAGAGVLEPLVVPVSAAQAAGAEPRVSARVTASAEVALGSAAAVRHICCWLRYNYNYNDQRHRAPPACAARPLPLLLRRRSGDSRTCRFAAHATQWCSCVRSRRSGTPAEGFRWGRGSIDSKHALHIAQVQEKARADDYQGAMSGPKRSLREPLTRPMSVADRTLGCYYNRDRPCGLYPSADRMCRCFHFDTRGRYSRTRYDTRGAAATRGARATPLTEDTMEPVDRDVLEQRLPHAVEAGEFSALFLHASARRDDRTGSWVPRRCCAAPPGAKCAQSRAHFLKGARADGPDRPPWANGSSGRSRKTASAGCAPPTAPSRVGVNVPPSQLTAEVRRRSPGAR